MSYDLWFFRIPDGVDPSRAYEELSDREEAAVEDMEAWKKRPIPDAIRAEMRRIADALKAWHPALQEFRPESPMPYIDLDNEELMVQFAVSEDHVTMNMPYFADEAPKMMECVVSAIGVLRGAAGYSAYDPQLNRLVDASDVKRMVAQYRAVDKHFPEVIEFARESKAAKKPWWKFW